MTRREARKTAFMLTFQKYSNDVTFDEAIEAVEGDEEMPVDDFVKQLTELTFTNLEEIDGMITPNLKKWTLNRLPKVSLAILRISTAQLLYLKDIPDSVVINEAVELAKEFGAEDEYSFVNGTLRNINIAVNGQK